MYSLNRAVILSLFLHLIALIFVVRFLPAVKMPQIVELTITSIPVALLDGKGTDSQRGGGEGAPPAASPAHPAAKSAAPAVKGAPPAAQAAPVQPRPAPAPARPVPVQPPPPVPALHPQPVQPVREAQVPRVPPKESTVKGAGDALAPPPAATAGRAAPGASGGTGAAAASGTGTGTGTGSGSGAASGRGSGRSGSGGPGEGKGNGGGSASDRYLLEHFRYIENLIRKNLVYPAKARRAALAGRAWVRFWILEDGSVTDVKVEGDGTGYEILDLSAVETVKKCAPFPKPPEKHHLRIPVNYGFDR